MDVRVDVRVDVWVVLVVMPLVKFLVRRANAMPSGWTLQSSSIFSSPSPTRRLPVFPDDTADFVTTYTLPTLVNGAPNAFAMVTAVWETNPIPVGVVGEQQGQFEYVAP